MTARPGPVRVLTVAALAAALAGCISLFPKGKAAQLYRFTGAAPVQEAGPAPSRFGVYKAPGGFSRAAAGDRILTLTGDQAAYIAQARWVSPAQVLFDEALQRAFDANPGAARLANRGETAKTDYVLRLDVRDFQAVYDQGPETAPLVVVRVRAVLTRSADRTIAAESLFEATSRADDNRVSAIARGFDRAVGQVLGKLVAWTNGQGAPIPAALPGA